MTSGAAVFVHGLFSSPRTWDPLVRLVKVDTELVDLFDCHPFPYFSPKWNFHPGRRIPDFDTIAASFSTFLDVECRRYDALVLVGHSQGGLVIQRYLERMLSDGRGADLLRVRRVVLLACPNNGSELLLSVRKALWFWRHRQERELRPLADSITDTLRRVLNSVVFTASVSTDRCPIPFAVYAGESDNIVTRASANSVFPDVGVLPGDHNSILKADSGENRTFATLRYNLLKAMDADSLQYVNSRRLTNEASLQLPSIDGTHTPILRVTTTTTARESEVQSQALEIFDVDTANLWIARNRSQPDDDQARGSDNGVA